MCIAEVVPVNHHTLLLLCGTLKTNPFIEASTSLEALGETFSKQAHVFAYTVYIYMHAQRLSKQTWKELFDEENGCPAGACTEISGSGL